MKLYSALMSPFVARVRIAVYAKGLDVELLPPPSTGLKTPEFLALNPLGKLPVLVLDDGSTLFESAVIVDYLEDAHPQPPLLPADSYGRAQVRIIARVAELYLLDSMRTLFGQVEAKQRDQTLIDAELDKLEVSLDQFEGVMGLGPYAFADTLTVADCEVAPTLFFVGLIGQVFQRPGLIADRPKLVAYQRHAASDPVLGRVLGEMQQGMAERMAANAAAA